MFLGTASASTQIEGAAQASDWRRWEDAGRVPPSQDGNGFGHRYRDDLHQLADNGLTVARLTFEWARLEPEPGRPDPAAYEHYREVLRAASAAGVDVWVCLHHVTLPGWFSDDEDGFRDERSGRYFWSRHVDTCAEAFGDAVAGWQPLDDPVGYAAGAYRDGTLPPGRRDESDFRTARQTTVRAAADAARLLQGGGAPVAASFRSIPAEWSDLEPFDLLGVTHEGDPRGLAETLHRIGDDQPDQPIVVTWGVATDDETHADQLGEAMAVVDEAAASGLAVEGFLHWTAVDGYEFQRGFEARYGLFDRDRNPREASLAVLQPRPR